MLNYLKNINSTYIYLPVLICSVALSVLLHYKIKDLQKQKEDLETTKLQLSLDSIDLIMKKNEPKLTEDEAELLSQIVVRHHLGDLTYAEFRIIHLVDDQYVAARAASILLKHPEMIQKKYVKYKETKYLLGDVIQDAYEAGKDVLE